MPPATAVKQAAQRAAEKASSVFRAIVDGPPHLDAGLTVRPETFQETLPLFRWRELSGVANHFGRRGHAAREVSVDLAAEISRRLNESVLKAKTPSSSSSSFSAAAAAAANPGEAGQSASASASSSTSPSPLFQLASGREVASVVYAFSKLREQLPEYDELYATVAAGVQSQCWTFNRLQATLVATALVDVQAVDLDETLPYLLKPIITSLREDYVARGDLTLDELRYLLHASVGMPGLLPEDVEVLAESTNRFLSRTDDFSKLSHIIVSWMSMDVPAEAKQTHQKALVECCKRLTALSEQRAPAHPLPKLGMAPAITRLMSREIQQLHPPLTPPEMGEISRALMAISRASNRPADSAKALSRSFSLEDWLEILPPVLQYCQAHSSDAPGFGKSQKELPIWASQMLGHVAMRTRISGQHVEPRPLRKLLQFLRRYKATPVPDGKFYEWAAEEVIAARERGAPPELLASLVSDLVPVLSRSVRTRLTQILVSSTPQAAFVQDVEEVPKVRVLQQTATATATSSSAWSHIQAPSQVSLSPKAQMPAATTSQPAVFARSQAPATTSKAAGEDLWNLLGPTETQQQPSRALSQQATRARRSFALSDSQAQPAKAPVEAVKAPTAEEELVSLTSKLELALERIASLESKLEDQAVSRSQSKPRKERDTITATRENRPHEAITATDSSKEAATASANAPLEASSSSGGFGWMGSLGTTFGSAWGSAGLATQSSSSAGSQMPAHMAMVHLHQPFNFEEWRRNESPRVQAERLRVVMPPDHIPFWPVPKKS